MFHLDMSTACGLSFTLWCLDLTAFLPTRASLEAPGAAESPEKGVSVLVSCWEEQGELLAQSRGPGGGGK